MLFDNESWKYIHQSKPPLRWLANAVGSIGSWSALKLAFAEEEERNTAAAVYGYIYSITIPIWQKHGSFYQLDRQIEEDI